LWALGRDLGTANAAAVQEKRAFLAR